MTPNTSHCWLESVVTFMRFIATLLSKGRVSTLYCYWHYILKHDTSKCIHINIIYIYIHIIIHTYANVHWGKVAQQIRVISDHTVAKTLSCYFSNLLPPWPAVHTAHFLRTTHLITKITRYLYCMIILCTFYCVYIYVCVYHGICHEYVLKESQMHSQVATAVGCWPQPAK